MKYELILLSTLILSCCIVYWYIQAKREKTVLLSKLRRALKISALKNNNNYFQGHINNIPVIVKIFFINKAAQLNITLKHNAAFPGSITITRETQFSTNIKLLGIDDVLTGNRNFDALYNIKASSRIIVPAFVDICAQRIIDRMYFNKGSIDISSKKLVYDVVINSTHFNDIVHNIKQLVTLCNEYNANPLTKKRLIRTIRTHNNSIIQIEALQQLANNFQRDDDLDLLLHELINHSDSRLVIAAARYIDDKSINDKLLYMLRNDNVLTEKNALAIIEIIAKNKYHKAIPLFKKLYNSKNIKVRIAILKAFEQFSTTELQPFLLKVLKDKEEHIVFHAVSALGTCGTNKAIRYIRLAGTSAQTNKTAKKCDTVIAMIQNSTSKSESGRLSIAEPNSDRGHISISEETGNGALSIKHNETQ